MLDIKFLINNKEAVKENIKKKFQDDKLPLVDEAADLYAQIMEAKHVSEDLRAQRNKLSAQMPVLMKAGKKEEAEAIRNQVKENAVIMKNKETLMEELSAKLDVIMKRIPQMIDASVPVGKDDSENVEVERFGEPVVPDYPIPYHAEIMTSLSGLDKDSAGRVAGTGFYYLMGDIARLHEAVLAYARDFMIDHGFTYFIPPFMMHRSIVEGVMSFEEMEAMMYKIEGEDLYLIGTSEHTMIGRFVDQIVDESSLPLTLTSYSPCFRKEIGSHGLEERGVYRIHQFEKQEMIVICKPEESMDWYNKMWKLSVDLFRSMEIPVRQLECCSGDLADLKVKSCDIEAWSPRQQKYFEVCSCSNLGDAQARRLKIRTRGENGTYLVHTLNNTVVAPPRMLIALLENHYQADGSVNIPAVLRPYMGGKEKLVPAQK
ncbi:MAG: serine--tRNA ligase [Oscillospiraceae bacterium]|nr:serine--tRNA ligase [Oscillospiraceae bacterium]